MSDHQQAVPDGETILVGGSWRSAPRTFERYDPSAPERLTGRFAAADAALASEAYAAAAAAQRRWAEVPAPERAEVLQRAAASLERRLEGAARRLTADMGKALRDARAEVRRSVQLLRYFAGELLQPAGEVYPSVDRGTTLLTLERPVGVVCAITPWNFPFAIPTWKLAPAIAFGNAVVWKPAEAASGSAVALAGVFEEAGLPPGVLNLLTGHGRELSEPLTGDARLGALTFTGSGPVGMALRAATADRLVKTQLELGGKNPAIVLADADLGDAAVQLARGAMLSTGQRCTATSRVLVERAVFGELLDRLRDEVGRFAIGDPYDEATDIGPLASAEQSRTVGGYLRLAHAEGVSFATGGSMPRGCFVEPAILTDVAPDSALVREEIFGPVVVVEPVDGYDEAVRRANDTRFGLSSALFTRDLARAIDFTRRAEAGLVHVNRETAGVEPHVPFGGMKASSSTDREQGKAARRFFTTTQTAYLRTV